MVGRQQTRSTKRSKRWGGLTAATAAAAAAAAAVATKEDVQVVHTEHGASIALAKIMNENGRAASTTACYHAATAYGSPLVSPFRMHWPANSSLAFSLVFSKRGGSGSSTAAFCPRRAEKRRSPLSPTRPSSSPPNCRAQARAASVCTISCERHPPF